MKKSIIALLAGILLFCMIFAACGTDKNDGTVTERGGGALTKESQTSNNQNSTSNNDTTAPENFMEGASEFFKDTVTGASDALSEVFD